MSQDIGDSLTYESRSGCRSFRGSVGGLLCSGGLEVAAGVEDQFAEELAGRDVDDAHVQVPG